MEDVPLELVVDIIYRLPAKDILRFRRVSKTWKCLIDCSNFVNLQLQKSIVARTHLRLIIRKNSDLFSVELDPFDCAVELVHPLMCYGSRIKIWGSCNGILCICNIADDIAFWNPSTRKYRILPSLPLERHPDGLFRFAKAYGFGYDSVHDDFKLLKISQYIRLNPVDVDSVTKVFSLRKFCWIPIQSMTYSLRYSSKMGVFVNGALHWVVSDQDLGMRVPGLVVAFVLATDKFKEIPLPEFTDTEREIHVDVLGGCLCLLANYQTARLEVWVMKEYGVKESWTKLLTVVSQVDFVGSIKSVKTLSYSKTGREVLLLQNKKKLIWYDLQNEKVHDAEISGLPNSFEAETLVESLIPVDGYREKAENILEDKRDDFLSEGFKLVL